MGHHRVSCPRVPVKKCVEIKPNKAITDIPPNTVLAFHIHFISFSLSINRRNWWLKKSLLTP